MNTREGGHFDNRMKRLIVLYENEDWFDGLFKELENRGIVFEKQFIGGNCNFLSLIDGTLGMHIYCRLIVSVVIQTTKAMS